MRLFRIIGRILALLEATPAGERERQALDMLRGWDGTMAGDSAAAAVYNAYYQAIPRQLFGDELRGLFTSDYTGETGYQAMVIAQTLAGQGGPWCDDVNTPAAESCADTLGLALTAGLEDMAAAQGSEIIDLSDLDASRFMHTTGQSGQALSNNYSNFITRWQKVEYLPMRFSQAAVDAAGAGTLTLTP